MSLKSSVDEVWRYRGLIGNFATRELKGKYRGSVLGSVWSLVNPLATLAVYSLVFGFLLKFPARTAGNGVLTNFTIYLFSALVVWNFFSNIVNSSMAALVGNGPLLRKIYFPPFAPVLGSCLAVGQQTAIEFGLLLIVLIFLANVSWTVLLLPFLLVLLAAFSLGVALWLSVLNAKYRDVNYLFAVVLNFLFYSAPIIYPIEMVRAHYGANPWLRIYEYNPFTVFVESFRNILWDLQVPSLGRLLYMTVAAVVVLTAGWAYFQSRSADISEDL